MAKDFGCLPSEAEVEVTDLQLQAWILMRAAESDQIRGIGG